MAITINGSGITSANIADGTIAAADLANTYLTPTGDGSGLSGTGKVLQVVKGTLTSSIEGTGDFDIVSATITPISSTSDIIISVYVQWSVLTNTGDDWGMRLQRDSDNILGETQNDYFISGGGVDAYDWVGQGSHQYGVNFASKTDIDDARASGITPITYKLRKVYVSGPNSKNVCFQRDGWGGYSGESNHSNCTIVLTEVAQ